MPTSSGVALYSTLAVRKALDDAVLAGFTRSSGTEVNVLFDPTTVLTQLIADGARPDVLISTTESMRALAGTGVLNDASVTSIICTGIGFGVAKGAAKPDISTSDTLVSAVRAARSVAYSRTGASGIYFVELLGKLGIAEEIEPRATVLAKGFTGEAVVDGRADLAVQQLSELAFVDGVDIVGPLPPELQHYTEFSAALGASPADRDASGRLLAYLSGPEAAAAYRATGLEPL
jgi:molybdate transport system substrate-binding protein